MKCPNCNSNVILGFVCEKTEYEGVKLLYDKMMPMCIECGKYIELPIVNDFNELTKRNVYNSMMNTSDNNSVKSLELEDRLNGLMEEFRKYYEMSIL